jgi:hypothetical protein
MTRLLFRSVCLLCFLLPAAASAQGGPEHSPLQWRELDLGALSPGDSAALTLVPDLYPTQWPVQRADLVLSGRSLFFLNGKTGSGTGFGYYTTYLFAGHPLRVVWTAVTREYVAESEFLPKGWQAFEMRGCLFSTPDSLGYVATVDRPSATATQALTTDSLVRPSAWYRWNHERSGLVAGAPVSQALTEACRRAIRP